MICEICGIFFECENCHNCDYAVENDCECDECYMKERDDAIRNGENVCDLDEKMLQCGKQLKQPEPKEVVQFT